MQNVQIKFIHYTPHFLKSFQKLPSSVQAQVKKKEVWFRKNPFDRRLRTHKLKGELAGIWAYSVNLKYRVALRFLNGNEAIYYDIGTHNIYR